MTRLFLIAVGGLLLASSSAQAQFFTGPGFGGGFGYRSHVHVAFRGPAFGFATFSRGFYAAPVVPFAPAFGNVWVGRRFINPWFGNPWMAQAWFGNPWFGNPWIGGPWAGPGFGPGFGNPFFLPAPPFLPPVALAPVIPFVNNAERIDADVIPASARSGEFLVIAPRKDVLRPPEGGTISPAVDRIAARPEKPPPVFRFDPFAEHQKIGFTEVQPAGAGRLAKARLAIDRGEFGLAIEHLDAALQSKPRDVETLFLKAQAQFAAGEYADAAATIQDGLRAGKGWVESDVQPRTLLGRNRFDGMIAQLRRTLAANPDSAALQLLLAHQLWFDGDRREAREIFEKLERRLKNGGMAELFLKS